MEKYVVSFEVETTPEDSFIMNEIVPKAIKERFEGTSAHLVGVISVTHKESTD